MKPDVEAAVPPVLMVCPSCGSGEGVCEGDSWHIISCCRRCGAHVGEASQKDGGMGAPSAVLPATAVPNGGGAGATSRSRPVRVMILAGVVLVLVAVAVAVGVVVTQRKDAGGDKESWQHVVVAAVKLPYSKSDFDSARQLKFRTGVAKAAGTSAERVSIASIKEAPTRRAVTGSIRVDFQVAAADAGAASELAATLTEDKLNQALEDEGLERGVMVAQPKATTKDQAGAPSPSPAAASPVRSPPTARRASYEVFETCEEISALFGGSASTQTVTAPLLEQPRAAVASPHFPDDYCDHCNCSIPKKVQADDRMYAMGGDAMPEAAAAGMLSARALPCVCVCGVDRSRSVCEMACAALT